MRTVETGTNEREIVARTTGTVDVVSRPSRDSRVSVALRLVLVNGFLLWGCLGSASTSEGNEFVECLKVMAFHLAGIPEFPVLQFVRLEHGLFAVGEPVDEPTEGYFVIRLAYNVHVIKLLRIDVVCHLDDPGFVAGTRSWRWSRILWTIACVFSCSRMYWLW